MALVVCMVFRCWEVLLIEVVSIVCVVWPFGGFGRLGGFGQLGGFDRVAGFR